MDMQDVFSGVWGSSATVAILGALIVFFVKRSLIKYDKHIENQYKAVSKAKEENRQQHSQVKDSMTEVKIEIGIISTQVKELTKTIDKINLRGCSWDARKDKKNY